jgi:hypothetical protein
VKTDPPSAWALNDAKDEPRTAQAKAKTNVLDIGLLPFLSLNGYFGLWNQRLDEARSRPQPPQPR